MTEIFRAFVQDSPGRLAKRGRGIDCISSTQIRIPGQGLPGEQQTGQRTIFPRIQRETAFLPERPPCAKTLVLKEGRKE
ncbi:hypothetical protein F7R91_01600 [Streptomyces luteolifulvus]|uniref:Uncharacterized protein n=1 Tax=Streptomyces luteolifulvus TaxID=2615112 RepID=A0A6H9VA39_9ACTN|nr:hypothetical protein [Streptomyces luteolifulvus]KAB1150701.1 hypothetical protein F7R91_01600 [Streptomyces luteolifulvus]